ncbi:kelch-like protein 17 [Cucumis melo var. makuwa]|uniref:Kelch-like protein 17 n=1 Tax=Cucumis melo var. makuwa TaxID=1194695 RepID=A0A5A7VJV9_CUCMM|nr:kelch-like protein 17 [Cucumis melo var. makuwa]
MFPMSFPRFCGGFMRCEGFISKSEYVKHLPFAGGYDGASYLSTLELYDPSRNMIKSLMAMRSVRGYAFVAWLNSQHYVLGGAKGSLRGVSIGNKLFAIGGGNGIESLTDVEMLTLDIGRWICTRSMLQRRFVAGAVELNGILYASEGFDGSDYLKQWQIFLFISTLVPT